MFQKFGSNIHLCVLSEYSDVRSVALCHGYLAAFNTQFYKTFSTYLRFLSSLVIAFVSIVSERP